MHRFFLPPEDCQGPELRLPESETHHAVHVLRLRERDRAVVLNGVGDELLCEVAAAERRSVRLRVVRRTAHPRLPYRLTLLQAVPKNKAMDWIVQKATELGAHRIVPLLSERTVAHWEGAAAAHKLTKWRAICIEAAKQCGTPWLPVLDAPLAIQAFLSRREPCELPLLASLQPEARHPREPLRDFVEEHRRLPQDAAVWIGPEGDFTPAEINAIRSSGAAPISLGPLVLRSDTAALYCLSLLSYELQAGLRPWP